MSLVLTATIAFLLAGFIKGVLGFGFPVIALIVLTIALGLFDALALIVVPTFLSNVWQGSSGPYLSAIMQRMWVYFLCAVSGILVASQFLTVVNIDLLTGLLGIVLVVFAISRLMDYSVTIPASREKVVSVPVGFVNGILTGFTGSLMVPSVIYMQALGFGKDMLVQAMGVFFALSTLTLAISLSSNSIIDTADLQASSLALLPSFAGIYLGRRARERIDEQRFQQIFLGGVLVLGSYIVLRAAGILP